MKYYLGIDQGTTGTTAVLIDENFRPAGRGYSETPRYFPAPGCVEHRAEEVWQGLLASVRQALDAVGADPKDIAAVGLDHEGESVVCWNGAGKALTPVIVWQDDRAQDVISALTETERKRIETITYLSPDVYFSAAKYAWLTKNTEIRGAFSGNLDAYLLFRMTNGKSYSTDLSTASRTQLLDVETGVWSNEARDIFGLFDLRLPEILDSDACRGRTDPDVFLGIDAPVCALLNDQQAALFGQGCFETGMLKTTYGTGCFMLMNTGEKPVRSAGGLLTTVAWRQGGKTTYALDGGVYIAGAAVQWLRDGIGIIEDAAETTALAESVRDTNGLYFVPAFTGLAAPHRDPKAAGIMIGISGGTTRAHIVRATLESIAYQVSDVLDAMRKDAVFPVRHMKCDGGATANDFLMQFQADITGIPLTVPAFRDATPYGVALMAGAAREGIDPTDVSRQADGKSFTPRMSEDERLTRRAVWRRAIERSKGWK